MIEQSSTIFYSLQDTKICNPAIQHKTPEKPLLLYYVGHPLNPKYNCFQYQEHPPQPQKPSPHHPLHLSVTRPTCKHPHPHPRFAAGSPQTCGPNRKPRTRPSRRACNQSIPQPCKHHSCSLAAVCLKQAVTCTVLASACCLQKKKQSVLAVSS